MFTYNFVFIIILHSSHAYQPEDKGQNGNFNNRVMFPLESGSWLIRIECYRIVCVA